MRLSVLQLIVVGVLIGRSASGLRCGDSPDDDEHVRYSVIVDAGSTGTRVHVYRFAHGRLDQEYSCTEKGFPAVTTLVGQPQSRVDAFLAPILNRYMEWVPPTVVATAAITPVRQPQIRIFLTGGARNNIKQIARKHLLRQLRRSLTTSGAFKLTTDHSVRVLTGYEEAALLYLHVSEVLDVEAVTAIDLGGQTMQLVLPLTEHTNRSYLTARDVDRYELAILGKYANGSVLPYSFEAGTDQAFGWYHANIREVDTAIRQNESSVDVPWPCHAPGSRYSLSESRINATLIGTGHFWPCVDRLRVRTDDLAAKRRTSLHPAIPDDVPIVIVSGAFHTALALGCARNPDTRISDIATSAAVLCQQRITASGTNFTQTCASAAYLYSLLVHGFGLSPSRKVLITDKVGSMPLHWGLGAALLSFDDVAEVQRALKESMSQMDELSAQTAAAHRDLNVNGLCNERDRFARFTRQSKKIDRRHKKLAVAILQQKLDHSVAEKKLKGCTDTKRARIRRASVLKAECDDAITKRDLARASLADSSKQLSELQHRLAVIADERGKLMDQCRSNLSKADKLRSTSTAVSTAAEINIRVSKRRMQFIQLSGANDVAHTFDMMQSSSRVDFTQYVALRSIPDAAMQERYLEAVKAGTDQDWMVFSRSDGRRDYENESERLTIGPLHRAPTARYEL